MTQDISISERRTTGGKIAVLQKTSIPLKSPTHEQIAARAKRIWEIKGCPSGKDDENWREAEAQLLEECQGLSRSTRIGTC